MPTPSFQSRWLKKFKLPKSDWSDAIDARLAELAFCDGKEAKTLLTFLFDKLPGILEKDTSSDTLLLAEAFAWTCFAFWQCGSAFPSFPENYATCLHKALRQTVKKRPPVALVLAKLIVPTKDADEGRCGFNQLALSQPNLIRESERLIHQGRYEDYLKAKEKYDEYKDSLKRSPEFKAD